MAKFALKAFAINTLRFQIEILKISGNKNLIL